MDRRTSSRFCDQRCTDAFHNHARASVAAREARDGREPCAFCKGPIPATRRAGAVFCSYRCKNAAGNVPSDKRRASNRRYMLKYTRGITVEEFDAMLLAQGGRCGICGTTEPGGRRGTFNVDHDHVTGKVRKLLCYGCNVGLGHFRDDPELCDAAAAYLRGHATV